MQCPTECVRCGGTFSVGSLKRAWLPTLKAVIAFWAYDPDKAETDFWGWVSDNGLYCPHCRRWVHARRLAGLILLFLFLIAVTYCGHLVLRGGL